MPHRGANSGRGLLRSDITPHIIDRFRKHIRQVDDCWIWTGAKLNGGHGTLRVDDKNLLVHRISYVLSHGDLQPGRLVRHTCNTFACVRPEHLRGGTIAEILRERVRNYPPYVAQIRESYRKGHEYWEIAPSYQRNLTPLQVRAIALNKSWVDPSYYPRQQQRRKPDTRRKLDSKTVAKMRRQFVKGSRQFGVAALARAHNVSYSVAWEAVMGKPSHNKRLQSINA